MANDPKTTELALILDRIAEAVEGWNDCMEDGDRGRGSDPLIMVIHGDGSGVFATSFYPPGVVGSDFPTYKQMMNVQHEFENTIEAAEYLVSHYNATGQN